MTTLTTNTSQQPASRITWQSVLTKLGPLIGLAAVLGLFSALRFETFFTLSNFELIIRQTAVVGIGALGMTLIIIAGGIDLSVGSAIALVTVVVALLLPHEIGTNPDTGESIISHGFSPWIAALGGIAVGTACGAVNGVLITRLRLVPFIITLAMMSLLRGLSEDLASNSMVYPERAFRHTYLARLLEPINPNHLWMLTPGAWLMLVLAVLVAGMLRYTRFGRHIFAVGSNEQTARLCGVPVERTKLYIYMLGAALTAIAAVLHFSYLGMGDCTTADGEELQIIAACVIGGASLNGGEGTILGSLVGALIMTTVATGCSKMGWPNSRQKEVTGVIIVLAVVLDQMRHRRQA